MSTPERPDGAAVLAALTAATKTLEDIGPRMDKLTAAVERERKWRWGLVASLLLDLALTAWLTISNVRISDVQGRAERNSATVTQLHGSNVSACQSGNALRAQQAAALDGVLDMFRPPADAPAAEQAHARTLLSAAHEKIADGWGPRNCKALYRLQGK